MKKTLRVLVWLLTILSSAAIAFPLAASADPAPSGDWWSITSSSDGSKLAAVAGDGSFYTSNDSGANWTLVFNTGPAIYISITSSSDGSKLAAAVYSGSIYTSNDSGANWTERTAAGSQSWSSIASSSDGTKLAAVVDGGYIYTSTDSGANWETQTSAGSRVWYSITSSSDGSKLAAAVNNGYIYTSIDSGAHWETQTAAGSQNWLPITSSSDGSKLAAAVYNGYIYTSIDSGAHWETQTAAGSQKWYSIASSSDGSKLAAVVDGGGFIYTSTDFGAHWETQTAAGSRVWTSITSSSGGSKLAAVDYGGRIYASTDSGATWAITPNPLQAVVSAGSDGISRSVFFPEGVKVAEIPASSALPSIKLNFAVTPPELLTVMTTTNSAPLSATPFMTSGSTKIVDIQIANHDGSAVTVCLEGDSTDRLYHYTGGAWVELAGRSYVNGQVCGVTNSFSPFTAAPAKPVANPASVAEAAAAAEKAAAEAAAAKREAERRDARVEILRRYAKSEAVTVETYQKAEISGITSTNVDEFNKEILRLPIEKRGDIAEISKVARKYEVVGLIGSDRVKSVYPSLYIEIGLVSADSKIKSTLVKAISGLAENQRSTYNAIKAAIEAKTAELQARTDRLAKVLARSTARNGK